MDGSNSVVIVAIPSQNDPIWKISSEKVPHVTLVYLGDQTNNPNLDRIEAFLNYCSKVDLTKFNLKVDHRGYLGPDKADVLFLNGSGTNKLWGFRDRIINQDDIRDAYNSTPQHTNWTPHLTLGYPDSPAKGDPDDIRWINFDRIALWTGDFVGPEFVLQEPHPMTHSSDPVGNVLKHFGTIGMKWGVRKDKGHEGTAASVRDIQKADRKFEDVKSVRKELWTNTGRRYTREYVPELNSNPKFKKLGARYNWDGPNRDIALEREYSEAARKGYQKILNEEAAKMGTNASGTRKYTVAVPTDLNVSNWSMPSTWTIKTSSVEHSDLDGTIVHIVRGENGLIMGVKFEEDDLAHFGVMGMKWGVRRSKVLDEARDRVKESGKLSGDKDSNDKTQHRELRAKAEKGGLRTLEDKDLQKLVKRVELEQKYRKIRQEEKEASQKFYRELWDVVGKEIVGAVIREGIKYKFKKKSNGGATKTTVFQGRVIEGATRAISRFPEK